MLDNHIPRLREEQRICTANLYLTTALLVICAIVSFLTVEAVTGWLLLGCAVILCAAYIAMGKLDAGITSKALLSALCQPLLILYLAGGEENGMLWLALVADLILTGAYFRLWVTLPQFLFTDALLLVSRFIFPASDIFPILGFQLAGAALLLTIWRGGVSWKACRNLSEELETVLELLDDLHGRLNQGFDRTLVRLAQMREQDELLGECSAVLRAKVNPVSSGIGKAEELLGKLSEAEPPSQEISQAQKNLQAAQDALEERQKAVAQVAGILRSHQGDIRAIQIESQSLARLTAQLYSLLRVQKDAIHPVNR